MSPWNCVLGRGDGDGGGGGVWCVCVGGGGQALAAGSALPLLHTLNVRNLGGIDDSLVRCTKRLVLDTFLAVIPAPQTAEPTKAEQPSISMEHVAKQVTNTKEHE